MNKSNIWVTFEIHDCQRHIPIYQLAETLGTEKLRVLHTFWQGVMLSAWLDPKQKPAKHTQKTIDMTLKKMTYHFQMAEKYLVKVIKPNVAAESFDDLRHMIYAYIKATFSNLLKTVGFQLVSGKNSLTR